MIESRWWPASAKKSNKIFYCMDYFDSYHLLLHRNPRVSERAQIDVLEQIAKAAGRVGLNVFCELKNYF